MKYELRSQNPKLSLQPLALPPPCQTRLKAKSVAVVGGGFAGLMAARRLVQHGVKVTVYEARKEVGGRVLSNPKFSEGRITEEGAELIGSFHTIWLALAQEYGLAMVSRMDPDLYEKELLGVRLILDKPLSTDDIAELEHQMQTRILTPLALKAAAEINHQAEPWLQNELWKYDKMSVQEALPKYFQISERTPGNKDEQLWKMIEFKLVNDEVAPLDKMNFLGLLCKVRAGQNLKFGSDPDVLVDPKAALRARQMRYWTELEIFRCADGCQTLATKIAEQIQTPKKKGDPKPAEVKRSRAVTHIDLDCPPKGVCLASKTALRDGKLVPGTRLVEYFDYVILAIPPSVWDGVTITPWDPKKEVRVMGMEPAVKFFSDVKERFWIKEKPPAAPYGGSLDIGQVWEGTDNQTRVDRKQGIVLSVFAGPTIRDPLVPEGARVPTEEEFGKGLKRLYPSYASNLNKDKLGRDKTLFSNWPIVPFIKTGYASPGLGQIFTIGQALSKPFHDRLFFAGEHTQMDFFGYMEGALRSGVRAAEDLIRKECNKRQEEMVARASPGPVARIARTAPIRRKTAFEREIGIPMEEELEAEKVSEELEERQLTAQRDEGGESLDGESVLLREDETELRSPEDLEELYGRCSNFAPKCPAQNILFLGAERGDEFKSATWLAHQGRGVMAINPRETAAARAFRHAGGKFIRARIEDLPPESCRFDLICENCPYPSGRHYVPPRPFAMARLSRLRPGGRWILITESPRYASLLKAVGDYDDAVRARFRSTLSVLSTDEAPPSFYPAADTRYRLIFRGR